MRRKGKWQPKLVAAVLAVGLAASPVQSSLSQAYADSKAAEAVTEEKEEPEKESGSKIEETEKDDNKKDTSEKVGSGEGKLDEENKDTGSNSGNQTDTEEKDQSGSDGDTEGTEETEKTEENKDESSDKVGDKEETGESKEAGSTEDETEAETEESTEESSKSDSKADTEESTEVDSGESKDDAETEETVESSEAEENEAETKAEETEKETEETKETEEQKEAEAVELSTAVSGVKVTVHAEAGVLPEDVKLEVSKITDEGILKNLTEAAGLEGTEITYETMALDVKLLDKDGEEVQPDTEAGELTVTFEKVAKVLDTKTEEVTVYHFEDEEGTGAEEKEVETKDDALTVTAEHFSPFLFAVKAAEKTGNVVAKIGNKGYTSLQEAFNVGGEVVMQKDVKLDATAMLNSNTVTLDLNGKTISAAEGISPLISVSDSANFTIEDSDDNGKIVGYTGTPNGQSKLEYTVIVDHSICILESGSIIAPISTAADVAIRINNGNFTMNGGMISSEKEWGKQAISVYLQDSSATINDGNIISSYRGMQVLTTAESDHSSIVTINDGTISSDNRGIYLYGSGDKNKLTKLVVNGGSVIGSGRGFEDGSTYGGAAIIEQGGAQYRYIDIEINGGDFLTDYGTALYLPQTGTKTIRGGFFSGNDAALEISSGKVIISGGCFNALNDNISFNAQAGNGTAITGAALGISARTNGESGYGGAMELNITGGEFIGACSILQGLGQDKNFDESIKNINIESGTFYGQLIFDNNDVDQHVLKEIGSGTFSGITGGIYEIEEVDAEKLKPYIAKDCRLFEDSGTYYVTDSKIGTDAIPVEPEIKILEDAVIPPTGASEEDIKKVQEYGNTVKNELENNNAVKDKGGAQSVTEAMEASAVKDLIKDYPEVAKLEVKLNIQLQNVEIELVGDEKVVAPKKMSFEVYPLYTVKVGNVPQGEPKKLDAQYLSGKTITFRLPIPSAVTESYAKVTHQGDVDYYDIEGSGSNQYIEVKATHFSEFVVEFTNSKPSSGSDSGGGSSTTIRNNGTWHQDNVGWWFAKTCGGYPADMWYECYWNGQMKWYHFNAQGYLDAGWFTDKDGATYYLHNQHDNQFGYMYTGWNWIDGKCYYFTPNTIAGGPKQGMLYQNGVTPDGYSVNETGAWTVNGTVQTK